MKEPAAIHASALIIDTHADTPQRFLDEAWHFTDPLGRGMINLTTARQGNLAAEFFAIWVDPGEYALGTHAQRALDLTHATLEQVRKYPEALRLCLTPDDILAARAEGRFAVLLGLEGGHAIENSLERLREFHDLGVRYMTLTWSNSNDWATSSGDLTPHPTPHSGLTPFGHDVIREMNRLGMIVDVSHVSDRTFADVLATSAAPVIASHSACRALTHSPRNLTDDQLRALASHGGVVMINFFPAFIDESWRLAWLDQKPARSAAHAALALDHAARHPGTPIPYSVSNAIVRDFAARIPRAPLASLLDHFDHALRVAGPEHVGIGTDFDGIPALPAEIDSAADLPLLITALEQRGHPASTIENVLSANFLRVFREVQSTPAAHLTL